MAYEITWAIDSRLPRLLADQPAVPQTKNFAFPFARVRRFHELGQRPTGSNRCSVLPLTQSFISLFESVHEGAFSSSAAAV